VVGIWYPQPFIDLCAGLETTQLGSERWYQSSEFSSE